MRKLGILLGMMTISILVYCQENINNEKIKVSILGTYHFNDPPPIAGFDSSNSDIKSPHRQKELGQVLTKLEQFKPTKILLEKQIGEGTWNEQYEKYLDHQDPDSLGRNEIYQIGFRLAKRLGHKKLYPFDFKIKLDFSSVEGLLKEDTIFSKNIDDVYNEIMNIAFDLFTRLDTISLTDIIMVLNSEYYIENLDNRYYMEILKLGKDDNYAGVEFYLQWLERNLKMFHNITRNTDFSNKNERLLIIVGSAHTKYLKDLIEDSSYYEYVDISKIL